MNSEETAADRNHPVHAFPMDSGYSLVSNRTLDWFPPSPHPIFSRIGDETHTDPLFSDVAGESSDIVTEDLTRTIAPQTTLTAACKEPITKVWLTGIVYFFRVLASRGNMHPRVDAAMEMSEWSNLPSVNPSTPLFIDYVSSPTTLQICFIAPSTEKRRKLHQVWHAYRDRIEYLRTEAQLDGITVNDMSETDFWSFFKSMPFLRKAGVILMDNGNLRAVWRDEHKNRLGLQFLGDQSVEYVIFKRRVGAKEVSRAAGFDTLNGFKKQIHAFDLKGLVYT